MLVMDATLKAFTFEYCAHQVEELCHLYFHLQYRKFNVILVYKHTLKMIQ